MIVSYPKGSAVAWSKDPGRSWTLAHYFDLWVDDKLTKTALIQGPFGAVSYASPDDLSLISHEGTQS
jgi:hypothetical protein